MEAYREIYTYETGDSTIPARTNLNPLLGFDGEIYVQGAHMFLNGVRSLVSVSPLSGECHLCWPASNLVNDHCQSPAPLHNTVAATFL